MKKIDRNEGIFKIKFEPAISILEKINWNKDVSLNCESEYSINNVSY